MRRMQIWMFHKISRFPTCGTPPMRKMLIFYLCFQKIYVGHPANEKNADLDVSEDFKIFNFWDTLLHPAQALFNDDKGSMLKRNLYLIFCGQMGATPIFNGF